MTENALNPRSRRLRMRRLLVSIFASVMVVTGVSLAAAPAASANTRSNWSHTIPHSSIQVGWTNDHAWVIADYADAIAYGSGFIAGQVCGIVSGEEGPFNPVSRVCSNLVTSLVQSLLQGHPRLTNHGLWMAFYVWPEHTTAGTW